MKNIIIKSNGKYLTFPANKEQEARQLMDTITSEYEIFYVSKMPFEALPVEIQSKAKSILKAFNEVNVVFEYGEFRVSAGYGIKSVYNYDHFVCGYYKQEDIYTNEERKQNFIEEFGYVPYHLQ